MWLSGQPSNSRLYWDVKPSGKLQFSYGRTICNRFLENLVGKGGVTTFIERRFGSETRNSESEISFVRVQLHNAADSRAPKQVRGVSRLRRYSAHVRHVAAHSPVCILPLKSLPAATRSPLFSLSAVCLHAWVAPLTCALCSGGTWTICTFTRVSIDSPRQPLSESARRRASAEVSASVWPAIASSASTQEAGEPSPVNEVVPAGFV
jgi:hypothetical protein